MHQVDRVGRAVQLRYPNLPRSSTEGLKMIKPSRIYRKTLPQKRSAKLLRFIACVILAPVAFSFLYAGFMIIMGLLWLALNAVGDAHTTLPLAATIIMFAILWLAWDRHLFRKAYRSYVAEHGDAEIEALTLTQHGTYSAADRKLAAAVLIGREST